MTTNGDGTPMHSPIRHAADTLLQRDQGVTLTEWLGARVGMPASLLLVQLTVDTDGVVVVDRRTVLRWRDAAVAELSTT